MSYLMVQLRKRVFLRYDVEVCIVAMQRNSVFSQADLEILIQYFIRAIKRSLFSIQFENRYENWNNFFNETNF